MWHNPISECYSSIQRGEIPKQLKVKMDRYSKTKMDSEIPDLDTENEQAVTSGERQNKGRELRGTNYYV